MIILRQQNYSKKRYEDVIPFGNTKKKDKPKEYKTKSPEADKPLEQFK